jgi:hypothetical protein
MIKTKLNCLFKLLLFQLNPAHHACFYYCEACKVSKWFCSECIDKETLCNCPGEVTCEEDESESN